MHGSTEFLKALTIVLGVAAVTTVLFQKLRQPVVLGYVIAGLIIGPHVPVPLVADAETVQTLSELGVILLMFSVGLELRIRQLIQIAPTAGVTAVVQCSVMVWLGFITGRLFGWTNIESLFTGAIIAISSTTIIAKAFDEQSIRGKLRELVVGILVVEDLIAILLMATLTAISSGSQPSAGALAVTTGRLVAFLIGLVVVGLLIIPRTVRAIVRLKRDETTLITCIGLCFGVALLAQAVGYSVALGAFIAGSLVAESGHAEEIEHLIKPVKDTFAAVFFVSVGMMIDPTLVARHWVAIAALTAVVVGGKAISVTFGAFLTGNGVRTSVQAGMSLAQIGEFSFIIAGLGLALGATGSFLYPVAVSVSAITTLSTPWLIRAASPVAAWCEDRLPQPLRTFAALYGSWIEQMRSGTRKQTVVAQVRRLIRLLLLDAALVTGIAIGASLSMTRGAALIEAKLQVTEELARAVVVLAAVILSAPFCFGILRVARRLGAALAEIALPVDAANGTGDAQVDLSAAPRRALVVTLQLAAVVAVGAPVLAITQPFFRGLGGAAFFLVLLGVLGVAFWRSATNLEGHVRAGAQVIVETLAAQLETPAVDPGAPAATASGLQRLLPGLGTPVPVTVQPGSAAVGRTLAQLRLRTVSGATVLAIVRGDKGLVPTVDEPLQEGDALVLAGTREAIKAAEALLSDAPSGPTPP